MQTRYAIFNRSGSLLGEAREPIEAQRQINAWFKGAGAMGVQVYDRRTGTTRTFNHDGRVLREVV